MPGPRRDPIPETITCRACAEPFAWDGISMRRPHYCPSRDCKRARQNDAAYRYFHASRSAGTATSTRVWQAPPPLPKTGTAEEPAAQVEAALSVARAARLARERAAGQRTFTIDADSTYVRADGVVVTVRGAWTQKDADPTGWGWNQ